MMLVYSDLNLRETAINKKMVNKTNSEEVLVRDFQ